MFTVHFLTAGGSELENPSWTTANTEMPLIGDNVSFVDDAGKETSWVVIDVDRSGNEPIARVVQADRGMTVEPISGIKLALSKCVYGQYRASDDDPGELITGTQWVGWITVHWLTFAFAVFVAFAMGALLVRG